MKESRFIVKKAKSMGACNILSDDATIEDLGRLMWHPQGKEFMRKKKFPSLESIRKLEREGYKEVIVDGGDVHAYCHKVAAAGNTNLTLEASGTREAYDVILFHGAHMIVEASKYAVVNVTRVGECEILFRNVDGTARMFAD